MSGVRGGSADDGRLARHARPCGVADGIRAATKQIRRAWSAGAGQHPRPLILAIDGPSGSGKSSLATPLAHSIARAIGGRVAGSGPVASDDARPRVVVVSTDLLATWDEPFGWWPILESCLLQPLAVGSPAHLPTVTWVGGEPRPGATLVVDNVDVLILEGVSSARQAIVDRLTAAVWVEVPGAAERLERAVARDGEAERGHLRQWQRDEAVHFARDGTRGRATIVIDPR